MTTYLAAPPTTTDRTARPLSVGDGDGAAALVTQLVGTHAAAWDRAGELPESVLRQLSMAGVLCAEVPTAFGGLGMTSQANGALTAHVGSLCSSLRSIMTSQGMAAWSLRRLAGPEQRDRWLRVLTSGALAAVAFSEPQAGSDLLAMQTRVVPDGDHVVLNGRKTWITAAAYADVIIVFARYGDGAATIVVPASTPGVRIRRIPDSLGCRAAGHSDIEFTDVRLAADHLLPGAGQPAGLLVTSALAYGRMSVAWGCVGILRACLAAAADHASTRHQFGHRLADHQLVARHLSSLLMAEQTATLTCERASRAWDDGSPELVMATVLAKHTAATEAARGATIAAQVLASAGVHDGHVVARAYRDTKVMELIEGSNEICELALAEHALARWA